MRGFFLALKASVHSLSPLSPARPLARYVGQLLLRAGLRLSRVGVPAAEPSTPLLDLILVEYEREKLLHASYALRSSRAEVGKC